MTALTYAEAQALVALVLRGRLDSDLEAAAWKGLQRAIEKYEPERGPFKPWAKYVMRQYICNQFRTWRNAKSEPGAIDDVADEIADTRPARDLALARTLRTALDRLPPRQAAAALLCLGEGLTSAAAGVELGVSPQAVNQLVHRARIHLQCTLLEVHHEVTK